MADLEGRPNIGLAFSGGGPVAAANTLGQLRALKQLGVFKHIRYISCVSASAWTCVPYIFLPKGYRDIDFLGETFEPQQISLENIAKLNPQSHAYQLSNASMFKKFIKNIFKFSGDETYSRALGEIFLEPYGLNAADKFFSYKESSLKTIIENNPDLSANDFYLCKDNRPFLIVGGAIMRLKNKEPSNKIHFEMTPMYLGAPTLHPKAGKASSYIGNSLIEPFAFDSKLESINSHIAKAKLSKKAFNFTLSDMMGTSSSAPAETLDRFNMDWLGFPEFQYWNKHNQELVTHEYNFGDGGFLENMGVMPLLARRVEKLVLFMNAGDTITHKSVNWSLPALFGYGASPLNTVFEKNKFSELIEELLNLKANGETLIYRDKYKVLDNEHYNVKGGWEVDITWVYNENVPKWKDQLQAEILERFEHRPLRNFPHYKLFFQNRHSMIELKPEQAFLASNLAEWNILNNQEFFDFR